MKISNPIIKFKYVDEQVNGSVRRIIGLVPSKHLIGIFDAIDLEANPRSAKSGAVTEDIIESIEKSPDEFPFKTKGVLIGSSNYEKLERNRYRLSFEDPEVEGILDGGHNMLAIGTQILRNSLPDNKSTHRIKNWPELKEVWKENRADVERSKDSLEYLVPVELVVPANVEDYAVVDQFNNSLLDICAARNNNVQLTLETKANKKGFYDEIRSSLPEKVSAAVEWKSNDGGRIKVRDIVALAWIPLNFLNQNNLLPENWSVSPQNIYRNKGECAKLFDKLMSDSRVSNSPESGYAHELSNTTVQSALSILGQIPSLYDKIYLDFPEAYNKATNGRFGRNPIVRIYDTDKLDEKSEKYMRTQPYTKFTEQPVKYRYPDGLIMPLVVALGSLMTIKDEKVVWATDPFTFLDDYLADIAKSYKLVLDMTSFDPQKIGKNETSYDIAVNEFSRYLD